MPPKRQKGSANASSEVGSDDSEKTSNLASLGDSIEDLLDRRLKQQAEQINDLFLKFTDITKKELSEVKISQDFLGAKFDDLTKSINELREDNSEFRALNARLSERVVELEEKVLITENDMESLRQYIRRDLLEIHGVPFTQGENTNAIVKNVAQIVDPNMELNENDISISHRLQAAEGFTPPIIVKFTRRDVRDKLYKSKRNLNLKTAVDLGYQEESRLFINESLTQKSRELLREVKRYKRNHNYKFVWTKHGKVLLRKDERPPSRVFAFTTMKEFEKFKTDVSQQSAG